MTVRRWLMVVFLVPVFAQLSPAKSSVDIKNPDQFVCESGITQTALARARNRQHRLQLDRVRALSSLRESITSDQGHIAVLEDDGTVITQPNRLDLANRSLQFTPAGSGRYSVLSEPGSYDDGSGSRTVLLLGDDDSRVIALPFPFIFYDVSYTSIHLNSDGNLTFREPDSESNERNLRRIVSGPPRISPLFDDLNPAASGQVTVDALDDRVLFTWTNIGEWSDNSSGSTGRNTFQAVLRSDGVIRFNYRSLDATQGVTGIAPGHTPDPQISLIDLSAQAPASTLPGVIAEVFATVQEMDLARVAEIFYRTHPDSYDGLAIFIDFPISLGGAFAYALSVRNSVEGIINTHDSPYDYGSEYGSAQRLSVVMNMGALSRYSVDPRAQIVGTNTPLDILSHEFGHRWLAFTDIGGPSLLGRQESHWSFLFNTFGSVMEGNEIEDLGNGRFRTVGATQRYSPLDQYIMGLRPASEVPPSFVVANPVLPAILPPGLPASCRDPQSLPSCAPFIGLQFSGSRRDVTIDDFLTVLGPRNPGVEQSPKDFRVAFILVTQRAQAPQQSSLQKLEVFRAQWPLAFSEAVDGRGTLDTDLLYFPPKVTSISPVIGPIEGGTQITITGSGFQEGSTVRIGDRPVPAIFVSDTTLLVTAPESPTTGSVTLTVHNPRDGQSSTILDAFTYVVPGVTGLRTDLITNGSRHVETRGIGGITQVGYATVESAVAVEVIRSYSGLDVRSEATMPAATIGTSFHVYAERTERTSTGLALVNTTASTASITLVLSNGLRTTIQLPARSQVAQFLHELLPQVGTSFSGILTLASDVPVGLAALRATTNNHGDFIITAVPLSVGSQPAAAGVFPQIADGQGYATEVILLNPTNSGIKGAIELSFNVSTDRGAGTRFPYEIPPGGVWKLRTSGTAADVHTGHGTIVPDGSNAAPLSMAILKQSTGTNLNFEAGIPAVGTLRRGMMFGVRNSSHRSVVAVAGTGDFRMTPYRADGSAAAATRTISLSANGRLAAFLDELIPDLPADFKGTVLIEASSAISMITLRTTINSSGAFLMAAMPMVNLDQPLPAGTSYFPQLADGGGFTTEFLLLSPVAATPTLRFFNPQGEPLSVPVR